MDSVFTYSGKKIRDICFGILAISGVGVFIVEWRKRSHLRRKAIQLKKSNDFTLKEKLNELGDKSEEKMNHIFNMNTQSVILAMQQGKLNPSEVLRAYTYKACSVTQNLNCVTGLIPEAEDLTAALKVSTECKLYGLPVSLKESLETKGMDATLGLASEIGKPANNDCVLATVLKHCGAIPFVKTNLSQLTHSFESSNPVFGTTVNPQNHMFTAGGSSAGEACLIGAGGSLLGFGTDTGGSIRVPAHICGITGFLPSLYRISTKGLKGPWGQPGPLAQDVDTLVLAMRALLCPLMFDLDPLVPPLPFNEELFSSNKKLRIGYYVTDGYNKPIPAIQRAVLLAKKTLENAGHELILFKPPHIPQIMKLYTAACYGNGDKTISNYLKHEKIDPITNNYLLKWKLPCIIRWILSTVIGLKYPRVAQDLSLHGGSNSSVTLLHKLEKELEYHLEQFRVAWKQANLDSLVCPPFAVVAGPLRSIENNTAVASYTRIYNFLHFPSGVVPVTKVNEADMEALKNYIGHYNDPWDWNVKKTCEGSLGVSVGIQCVALPYQDEVCLRLMKEIETLIALH